MTTRAIWQKLTSRKLWLAIAGVASGIAQALGSSASDIDKISGAVLIIVSAGLYIITEGRVDAAYAKKIVEAVEVLNEEENTD